MGSKQKGGDDDVIADINITPFVDIILVVLIIFMVTATQIVHNSIKVELPEAASADPTEQTSLGLTLTKEGDLLLDGVKVTTPELKVAIDDAKAKNKDVICLIAADKAVAYGRIVWLLDFVKSEGVAKYAFNIDKEDAIGPDPAAAGLITGYVPAEAPAPPTP